MDSSVASFRGQSVGKNAEQLFENRLGDNQLVLLLDNAPQRRFTASARKNQSRDENVGVDDNLHSCK